MNIILTVMNIINTIAQNQIGPKNAYNKIHTFKFCRYVFIYSQTQF